MDIGKQGDQHLDLVTRVPSYGTARDKIAPDSAQNHDDQVGNADGDDAAGGTEQEDALKSCHSALPRELVNVQVELMRCEANPFSIGLLG
jgi:hypothetical protein